MCVIPIGVSHLGKDKYDHAFAPPMKNASARLARKLTCDEAHSRHRGNERLSILGRIDSSGDEAEIINAAFVADCLINMLPAVALSIRRPGIIYYRNQRDVM